MIMTDDGDARGGVRPRGAVGSRQPAPWAPHTSPGHGWEPVPCPNASQPNRPSARIEIVTAKEKVLEHLPHWTEDQAERALLAAEGRRDVGSYMRTPQFEPDGWADLETVNEASRSTVLKRLDEEERKAGLQPW